MPSALYHLHPLLDFAAQALCSPLEPWLYLSANPLDSPLNRGRHFLDPSFNRRSKVRDVSLPSRSPSSGLRRDPFCRPRQEHVQRGEGAKAGETVRQRLRPRPSQESERHLAGAESCSCACRSFDQVSRRWPVYATSVLDCTAREVMLVGLEAGARCHQLEIRGKPTVARRSPLKRGGRVPQCER
jgi:hypothetical protein